jgi:hypothetical protein
MPKKIWRLLDQLIVSVNRERGKPKLSFELNWLWILLFLLVFELGLYRLQLQSWKRCRRFCWDACASGGRGVMSFATLDLDFDSTTVGRLSRSRVVIWMFYFYYYWTWTVAQNYPEQRQQLSLQYRNRIG